MTTLRVNNFGGEIPRMPARALPAGAAQINSNLLATATEFRPLQSDSVVGTAPAGAKTLYRLSKDSSGVVRTLDAAGWIAETADKNYVKGQINDDGTERTYLTFNDGTKRPRAIDALGADRLMGVPSPFYATAVLVEGESFTSTEATAWADGTLIPALHAAFLASLPVTTLAGNQISSRVSASKPVAGAYSMYGMVQNATSPWLAERVLPLATAKAAGLNDPMVDPLLTGSTLTIQALCLPYWGRVGGVEALSTAIRLIENPRDGSQLFTDPQIAAIVAGLVAHFDPDDASVKTLRTALDVQIKTINAAIDYVLTPPTAEAAPTVPAKPTVPEYYEYDFGGGGS